MKKILLGTFCLFLAIALLFKAQSEIAVKTSSLKDDSERNGEQREMEEWTEEQKQDAKAAIKVRKKAKSSGNEKSASLLVDIEEVGPNVSGETAVYPTQTVAGGMVKEISTDVSDTDGIQSNDRIVVATETGGAWISEDAGSNWYPIDDDWAFSRLDAVAQDPNQPNKYYFGGSNMGLFQWDASTWTINGNNNSGLEATSPTIYANGASYSEFLSCSIIRFHPSNSNHFFVKGGVAFDYGGIFETTDGGNTFYEIFDLSGVEVDDMEVLNDKVLLASNNGIYKLIKTGTNWNHTLVKASSFGNVMSQIDALDSNPNIVYAYMAQLASPYQREISRSFDGGNTWSHNANGQITTGTDISYPHAQAFTVANWDSNYHLLIYGSQDAQTSLVYKAGPLSIVPQQNLLGHADYQDFQVFGNDVYVGNDGGIFRYNINSLNTYQPQGESLNHTFRTYQSVDVELATSGDRKLMAMWHNGTTMKDNNDMVHKVSGWDGFEAEFQPNDNTKYYTTMQNGNVRGFDSVVSTTVRNLTNPFGSGPFETRIFAHSALPNALFMVGLYDLWYLSNASTCNSNCSWTSTFNYGNERISSYARLKNQVNSPVYLGIGTSSQIDKITSLSPANKITLSNDYSNITLSDSSPGTIWEIAINPQNSNELFVIAGWKLYRVEVQANGTAIWYEINDPTLGTVWLNELAVSPDNPDHLMLGTRIGLYTSTDGGQNWDVVTEIPAVAIEDIEVRDDGYVGIATYGRGNWTAQINGSVCELDDVTNTFGFYKKKGAMFFTSPFDEPGYDYLWTASGNFHPTFNLGFNPGIAYSFANNGVYTVCLTITSQTDPSCTKTICRSVSTSGFFGFIGFMLPKGENGEELELQFDVDVYPNPASDLLNLVFEESVEGTAMIYNLQGQLMREFPINGYSTQVDLQKITAGNYILAIVNEEQLIARKQFVVSK